MGKKSVDELTTEFAKRAIARGEALQTGDHNAANSQLSQMARVERALIGRGEEGRNALSELLQQPNPWVRVGAATFTINFAESETVAALEDLADAQALWGVTSKLLLDWAKKNRPTR